jgi:hypothetical protein
MNADLYEGTNTTHIDLSRLLEEAKTRSRKELVKLIEEKQEELVRAQALASVKRPLFALIRSAEKHLVDGDVEGLR